MKLIKKKLIFFITTFREIVFEVEIFFIFSRNVYSTTAIDLILYSQKKKLNLKKISYKKYFIFNFYHGQNFTTKKSTTG